MQEISRNQTEQVHVERHRTVGRFNYQLTLLSCTPVFVSQRVRGKQRMAIVIMGFDVFWTGTCFGRITSEGTSDGHSLATNA